MRKPVIAGNWKMYKTPKESLAFLEKFLPLVEGHDRDDIVLFPTMSSLGYVLDATNGTNVRAGAQTMHWMNEGPYTGQTSPTMLASIDCTHVLLGHSERRIYAHETDDMVNWKLKAAIAHGLTPVVCVGEPLVGDRHGQHRYAGAGAGRTPDDPRRGGGKARAGAGRLNTDPVRRLGETGEYRKPDVTTGYRWGTGGRRQPGPGDLRKDRPLRGELAVGPPSTKGCQDFSARRRPGP